MESYTELQTKLEQKKLELQALKEKSFSKNPEQPLGVKTPEQGLVLTKKVVELMQGLEREINDLELKLSKLQGN